MHLVMMKTLKRIADWSKGKSWVFLGKISCFFSEDNVFLSPIQASDASESLEEKRNMVTRLGPNSRPTSPLIPVRAAADQIPGGGDSQMPPIGIESNASLLDLAYKTALGKFIVHK